MILSSIKTAGYRLRYIPILFIGIYQKLVSPFIFPACRFYPSCSMYARLAFEKYGIWKGGMLTFLRIIKCHPFHPGGYDPLV